MSGFDYADTGDPVAVTMQIVAASTAASQLADGRVYGQELPAAQAAYMPRTAVVIGLSPGGSGMRPGARDLTGVTVSRVDVRCYGRTFNQAALLGRGVRQQLKQWQRGEVSGVIVYWFNDIAGPTPYRASPADTPAIVYTFDVMHSDARLS